ncbi:1-phosphofructokinase family hexose kinase [Aureimonas psammosilenae]|uniref:1-phosphofructokinase family hexose kinase n=1 Tax=Aureimonas psammosilenae TaxID=2495496 RepID=UPI00186AB669|nr:PfkB family carbohydrate kinase [Aureimonas psammosilenae]
MQADFSSDIGLAERIKEKGRICVFAPWPIFTVTIERHATGADDVYFHAGGQAVWVARMVAGLNGHPILVGPFGGEAKTLLEALVASEGIELRCVPVKASNGGYVDDRREGTRLRLATVAPPTLDRHEADDLYNATLAEALRCGTAVLTGLPDKEVLPTDFFHRLLKDLRANDVRVVADVAGPVLEAIETGLTLLKISHEELNEAGLAKDDSPAELFAAMDKLRGKAENVVVSRAGAGSLARFGDRHFEAKGPEIHSRDHTGAGDSMTAALAVALAAGLDPADALRLATAAGAMNVTRGGRGTGRLRDIEVLAARVEIKEIEP